MKKVLAAALIALFASATAAWACPMGSKSIVMSPVPAEETQSASTDGYSGS